jgi:hypothetical protein
MQNACRHQCRYRDRPYFRSRFLGDGGRNRIVGSFRA